MNYGHTPLRQFFDVWTLLATVTVVVGCFYHFYRIDQLPMGFFVDESSIGYNAHLIAETGADEHGVRWPLYFEAFGEYKNPLYIYWLAGMYRVFGYSEWTTRALSACCWLAGSVIFYALAARLFTDRVTRLYMILSLAFTPWLFALSRISFELISLYPLLALHLLALYRGFEEGSLKWAMVAGASIALCLYAYTTFRLLAPLHALLVFVVYCSPRYRRLRDLFILGAGLCVIPFALYTLHHIHNLTSRFDTLTYLRNPAMSVWSKTALFLGNYLGYFSPDFLLVSGDRNLRHHSGFAGEFLAPTVLLLFITLITIRRAWLTPFRLYLLGGLLLSPVAAALTLDSNHSLRSFSMVVFALIISGYAFARLSPSATRTAVALTATCALLYLTHYFTIYPQESAIAFGNYGFKEALLDALSREPRRVVLSDSGNVPYINLLFFGSLSGTHIPLRCGSASDLQPGDVFIRYDSTPGKAKMYSVEGAPRPTTEGRFPR